MGTPIAVGMLPPRATAVAPSCTYPGSRDPPAREANLIFFWGQPYLYPTVRGTVRLQAQPPRLPHPLHPSILIDIERRRVLSRVFPSSPRPLADRPLAPARSSDGSQQNLASLRGNDTDAAGAAGDASSASGGNAGGHVGSSSDTHTHTHTHSHTHGVLGWLLDRVAEGWARVRSAFGDG